MALAEAHLAQLFTGGPTVVDHCTYFLPFAMAT